ncbi:uncharacterized protein F5891DRAFT_1238949 [Suillus fuscotomentosus]|uniref:Uncharacterized protein n=1 Tax=Suillus fuscotomentosus TaxID=1912939 RepID=A0AAD4HS66_9AGAM|nr:uncharacterized protein F5891DRAFT_1238949 [Suillus fuscotomentosus]KAG1906807.1 hypothetical protein F5891DRAFT_1238949 [Suillus fuscotomentosus]
MRNLTTFYRYSQEHHLFLSVLLFLQWLSKFNSDKFIRFIHEPWTANTFWEYQSQIPSDAKLLAFILYTDKVKLSLFGRAKGYPVIAWCANLPVAIRNGEGLGGGRVVGWLPIVKEDKKHSGKPVYVNLKNAVWHQSFLKILACLALLLKFGSAVKCWDDIICIFYPIILILSADYEEQSVMALIRGLMGKFPCPICLVPHDELSKTSNIYPLCTSAGAKALRVQAQESTTLEAREQILSSKSLRDVDNSFDTMENTDVHRALSNDKLHFNYGGLFSDHLWAELQKWIESSGQQAAKYIEDMLDLIDKSWNFPKKHLSAHLFDNIEAKGVTRNYNTKPNEKMHGPLKDAYQDHTNFKNFAEQILRYNHDSLIAEYIRGKLSCLNAQKLSLLDTSDLPEIDSETESTTDGLHFSLGSPQAMQSFADVEASKTGNPAFIRFQIKLNEFLNHAFNANNIPFPNGRRIQLTADDTITEYRFLKVNYASLVDWHVSADYLRCSPMFHGLPRYDFVILQTEASVIFAQLLMVFTCMVGDVQYPIVLTLPYDQPVGARPRKDKDLDFWQVKAKPQVSAEFFLVQSIIHGCVLVEDSSRPNEALVVDTLDTDMFLRIKEIRTNSTTAGYGELLASPSTMIIIPCTTLPLTCRNDKGPARTPEEKKRQLEDLSVTAHYCHYDSEADCQWSLILAHFNKCFDSHLCPKGCDNCLRGGTVFRQLYTLEAQQVQAIRLFGETASTDRIALSHFKDAYMGWIQNWAKVHESGQGCGFRWRPGPYYHNGNLPIELAFRDSNATYRCFYSCTSSCIITCSNTKQEGCYSPGKYYLTSLANQAILTDTLPVLIDDRKCSISMLDSQTANDEDTLPVLIGFHKRSISLDSQNTEDKLEELRKKFVGEIDLPESQ